MPSARVATSTESIKELVKRRLPHLRWHWRRLSRLRWLAKYRVIQYMGAPLMSWTSLRYILWDPEVESHSYEIDNRGEMAAFCAAAFDLPVDDVHAYMDEAATDPELTVLLRRRTRWAFDLKTEPRIGHRLLWWVLVRGRKPALIVETGVYDGLGSLVLLAAAERNARNGGPDARVIGIDVDERCGRLVPAHLEHRWERVIGDTHEVLDEAIGDREVGVFVHETPHTREIQEFEFGTALGHAGEVLTVVDGSGGQHDVLAELASAGGGVVHHAVPIARRHPGRKAVDFATFRP
jgi:hypothetical protein